MKTSDMGGIMFFFVNPIIANILLEASKAPPRAGIAVTMPVVPERKGGERGRGAAPQFTRDTNTTKSVQ